MLLLLFALLQRKQEFADVNANVAALVLRWKIDVLYKLQPRTLATRLCMGTGRENQIETMILFEKL